MRAISYNSAHFNTFKGFLYFFNKNIYIVKRVSISYSTPLPQIKKDFKDFIIYFFI